ncbi:MAG: MlaD family protein [Solirubrobacterales bacterium]
MRRILLTALAVAVVVALVLVASAGGSGSGGSYLVRAYFDNGGFVVNGEDVRVAGANVGSVQSVDVSLPGEIDSCRGPKTNVEQCAGGRGAAIPGKAAVVLEIADPGFQDFRTDATCLIRPQSLIGEKYVDCEPTQQRAPGSKPPPELRQIPGGQEGSGQYLLPVENNGKAVDLDLIQNINRQPYADRFRLILNDLGAGLAARGKDLEQIVLRADPALRQTNKVLAILAAQNRQLARLAQDSDAVLEPLARERTHITGFIRNAGETAAATAERSAELELNLQKLPQTLTELRLTMNDLGRFSDAARPVVSVLGGAAPSITRATRALSPFSEAATISLKSLGDAAEKSGPALAQSDPIVRQVRGTATNAENPTFNLAVLTSSLKRSGAFPALMKFLLNSTAVYNGFDKYGHYQRTNILVSSCVIYQQEPFGGCGANFTGAASSRLRGAVNPSSREAILRLLDQATKRSGGLLAAPAGETGATTGLGTFGPAIGTIPGAGTPGSGSQGRSAPNTGAAGTGAGAGPAPQGATGTPAPPGTAGRRNLDRGSAGVLRYLLGP